MRAPVAETLGDWRAEVKTTSGLNVLAGIWLVISPLLVGYTAADAVWNPIVFGAIVLVLAAVRVFVLGARSSALSVVNAAIGAWLFASAWWLAVSDAAVVNAWVTGLVVFLLAAWSGVTSFGGKYVTPV